jgi:hypothetical protein
MRCRLGIGLVLLLLAAPAPAAAKPWLYTVGDSLAVGTDPYLAGALPGWGLHSSTAISRHAPDGPPILAGRARLARHVAVSLGTNDDPRGVETFRGSIRRTMRVAGARRCVVWANIVRPPVAGASYASMNDVLRRQARKRENLVMVDWARLVGNHPGWLAGDGVHVSADGYRARARAFARALRRCP